MQMQGLVSDKTFHLKWNNHLQNLSQLFTTIYSSSALADVTLSCRDGTLKAHKLVLSACSPYFEQIFRDNPCQHPIVILKGIPFSEINLLVEFMYKGSVDVQELDLQSLMHTASELEIRGLAYEARDNAAQLLNVNLEYPSYSQTTPSPQQFPQVRTDVERLKQIHMYQQSMMRAEEIRRRRRDDPPGTHMAVNNILAAAAREMEEARHAARAGDKAVASIQTEHEQAAAAAAAAAAASNAPSTVTSTPDVKREPDDERSRKRASILSPEDERLRVKKKPMTVRFQDDTNSDERPNKITSPGAVGSEAGRAEREGDARAGAGVGAGAGAGGIKVVQLAVLQKPTNNEHDRDDSDERSGGKAGADDDEETDSSGSVSDSAVSEAHDGRPHVCDICDLRFQRSSHLSRHRLTHTGERPFTCGGCGRSFARSDKLRVHTKICEREDPTVDMNNDNGGKRDTSSEVMSGMVRTTHRESGHLVFTPGGDVMLPPRHPHPHPHPHPAAGGGGGGGEGRDHADGGDPPRRGRGRPRKTPLPLTPKIKKKRGRPPKTSLDMEGSVLTSGSVGVGLGAGVGGVMGPPQPLPALPPSGQQLLQMKRKRGRPPKNYLLSRPDGGQPNENYNATNLPFGDFSYLTEMMYNPLAYSYRVTSVDPDRNVDGDHADHGDHAASETSHERTIDVSDSSTDDDDSRVELEEHVPPVAVETQIMTVGDCQIVKLSPAAEDKDDRDRVDPPPESTPPAAADSAVTITPITTVGDCTIRPVENNT